MHCFGTISQNPPNILIKKSKKYQKLFGISLVPLLPFLGSLSVTPPGDHGGGGYNKNFTFKVKANFGCTPPPVITGGGGGWHLNYPKTVSRWERSPILILTFTFKNMGFYSWKMVQTKANFGQKRLHLHTFYKILPIFLKKRVKSTKFFLVPV